MYVRERERTISCGECGDGEKGGGRLREEEGGRRERRGKGGGREGRGGRRERRGKGGERREEGGERREERGERSDNRGSVRIQCRLLIHVHAPFSQSSSIKAAISATPLFLFTSGDNKLNCLK